MRYLVHRLGYKEGTLPVAMPEEDQRTDYEPGGVIPMERKLMTRRRLLTSAAGLGAGLTVPTALWAGGADEAAPQDATEARQRLLDGNKRFIAGESIHGHASKDWRKRLTAGQKPFATILSCSDSRVPPELVFDQGFGDLFAIRIAGNVISTDVVGSLQYAEHHLHVPLLVVLGHEGCGAVAAAVDAKFKRAQEPERIEALVRMIEPGLKDIDPMLSPERQRSAAVKANVRWSMTQLAELPDIRKALKDRRFEMIGAVYELETGKVSLLP
jgi:carbonic anhydrase